MISTWLLLLALCSLWALPAAAQQADTVFTSRHCPQATGSFIHQVVDGPDA